MIALNQPDLWEKVEMYVWKDNKPNDIEMHIYYLTWIQNIFTNPIMSPEQI